jgi:hypothetical protein
VGPHYSGRLLFVLQAVARARKLNEQIAVVLRVGLLCKPQEFLGSRAELSDQHGWSPGGKFEESTRAGIGGFLSIFDIYRIAMRNQCGDPASTRRLTLHATNGPQGTMYLCPRC